jgi:ribA/ribD-fused uncharacterized protein
VNAAAQAARLRAAIAGGARPSFTFFWNAEPKGADASGASRVRALGPECLSQWYPSRFRVRGVDYATAEHFMMAEKARLFEDGDAHHAILATQTPAEAKALGRTVRGFDGARWDALRCEVVLEGNLAKFEQAPALRAFLLGTGEDVLVEASPHDRIWGIGLSEDDPRARDPFAWRGLNLLGFVLMNARERLGQTTVG